MNRALLVSLLKKNIDELILLTEGFSEMSEYPAAIIHLARNKTDDIRSYIDQLGNICENTISTAGAISDETIVQDTNLCEDTEENLKSSSEIIVAQGAPEEVKVIEEEIIIDKEEISQNEENEEVITETEISQSENEEAINISDIEEITIIDLVEEPEIVTDNAVSAPQEAYEALASDNTASDKKISIAEKLASQTITRNELHAKNEAGGINNTINYKKVDDIRQAISLGDRFRFQRELFRNNGEEMNKMLNYINLLASYDEIVSFLQAKYGWAEDHPAANDFYQIIKRKF